MAIKSQNAPSPECDISSLGGRVPAKYRVLFFEKLAIILLLVGLGGLATLAKDGQYYPPTTAVRHVSLSTKMNVTHASVVFDRGALDNFAPLVTPKARPAVGKRIEPQPLPIASVGVTVSVQHRSPPAVLS
jgi:hypothetical protein